MFERTPISPDAVLALQAPNLFKWSRNIERVFENPKSPFHGLRNYSSCPIQFTNTIDRLPQTAFDSQVTSSFFVEKDNAITHKDVVSLISTALGTYCGEASQEVLRNKLAEHKSLACSSRNLEDIDRHPEVVKWNGYDVVLSYTANDSLPRVKLSILDPMSLGTMEMFFTYEQDDNTDKAGRVGIYMDTAESIKRRVASNLVNHPFREHNTLVVDLLHQSMLRRMRGETRLC